ncbi:MAG: hypothetical protein ACHQNV_05660 [Vicinamibacteria bacterium]
MTMTVNRPKAFFLVLSLIAVGAACSSDKSTDKASVVTPPVPTPTPAPTPTPVPTPTPFPAVSSEGYTLDVFQFSRNSECKRHVAPTGTQDLRVGCSVEIDLVVRNSSGGAVKIRQTGENIEWGIAQGRDLVTLPWDENPWKRWLTGVAPGHYRIVVFLTLPSLEKIRGVLEGDVVS